MRKLSEWFFKNRSYTPIPFLVVILVFADFSPVRFFTGFVIALSGEALRLWAVSYAGSETRTTKCAGGTYLIVSGPYAYLRNPLYVGDIMIYTGLAILSNVFFPFFQILVLAYFFIQYRLIIISEEEYLRNCFGEHYEEYSKSVPRFIPKFKPFRKNEIVQPGFSVKAGLISERRSLQAFIGTIALLLIIYWVKSFG